MNQSTTSVTPLQTPILHVDGLTQAVQDEEIVGVLSECLRLRLNLNRHGQLGEQSPLSGTVEFETLESAERAYATANNQIFPQHSCSLSLHLSAPPVRDPEPLAQPRLLKSLPRHFTAGKVFDLCREFGPIHSATLQLAPAYPPSSGPPKFKGQALVTFYQEEDARNMMESLQYSEVEGLNIIVALWDPRRAEKGRRSDVSTVSLHSATSSPARDKAERTSRWAHSEPTSRYPSSLGATSPEFASPAMSRNVSGASRWSDNTADTSYRENRSPKTSKQTGNGLSIDPCNLFVKSLDPSLTSEQLYGLFSHFGEIISARVMVDTLSSRSKEFGFVSFKEPEQADSARRGMDGKLIGSKHITVRLHEPKRLRESRLSVGGTDASNGSVRQGTEEEGVAEKIETGIQRLSTSAQLTTPSPRPGSVELSSPLVAQESAFPEVSTTVPSERSRLLAAVDSINPTHAAEIVALIEGLPRKEQVMCLFNPEVLGQKVQDALLVLEASKEEEDATRSPESPSVVDTATISISTSPSTSTPHLPSTISELARLPSADIVPLLPTVSRLLDLSFPNTEDLEATDRFMNGLEGLPVGQIKQKLGEKLFKVIKKAGVKRSPKITIDLLDTEDLRSLSTLLHYPEILREKALLLSGAAN